MKLEEAMQAAEDSRIYMVHQESKMWHHRGIKTAFDDADYAAEDWKPLEIREALCHNFK